MIPCARGGSESCRQGTYFEMAERPEPATEVPDAKRPRRAHRHELHTEEAREEGSLRSPKSHQRRPTAVVTTNKSGAAENATRPRPKNAPSHSTSGPRYNRLGRLASTTNPMTLPKLRTAYIAPKPLSPTWRTCIAKLGSTTSLEKARISAAATTMAKTITFLFSTAGSGS